MALSLGVAGSASAAPGDPIGVVDSFYVVPGGIGVTGWALQGDAPTVPNDVHIYVDQSLIGYTNAGVNRPDIAAAFPGYGPYHGYRAEIPYGGIGSHQVCVYAINHRAGAANPVIGCKVVDFPRPVPASSTTTHREEAAVAWAQSRVGQSTDLIQGHPWDGFCDNFVAQAFGRSASGYNNANEHWLELDRRRTTHHGDPGVPRGALAFFAPTGLNKNDGHVMISRGDGTFVSTASTVRIVDIAWAVRYSGPYLGWSYANTEWKGR